MPFDAKPVAPGAGSVQAGQNGALGSRSYTALDRERVGSQSQGFRDAVGIDVRMVDHEAFDHLPARPGDKLRGNIGVALDTKDAPVAAGHFIKLAKAGVYDGSRWHRIIKDFVIQGGAPGGDPTKNYGKSVVGEVPKGKYAVIANGL